MEYFYVPAPLISPPAVRIEGDEFSHLRHVMRMREGDPIRIVDGTGNAYDAVITGIARHAATCMITAHHAGLHEVSCTLTLAVGILKNPSRFDYLVEKAVEIGVRRIVPLITERTIPRHAKIERWRTLCIAAMKQSGRCLLPTISPLTAFDEFLPAHDRQAMKLIPHEQSAQALAASAIRGASEAVLCIGPEGGFSEAEISRAIRAGFEPVSLGPTRLRSETAAIVASALILQAARP